MPFIAKDEGAIEELKMENYEEIISDEELRELIKPEIVSLNVPAILELLFGLFLLFVAILEFGYYYAGLGSSYLMLGIAFIIAMLLSFVAAYGLIIKSRFLGYVSAGKGIFFIFYFLYAVFDYSRLAEGATASSNPLLGDLNRQAIYETNMMINLLLFVFVLILAVSVFHKLYIDGHLDVILKRRGVHTRAVNSVAAVTEINNK
jgi:hypothetical protein